MPLNFRSAHFLASLVTALAAVVFAIGSLSAAQAAQPVSLGASGGLFLVAQAQTGAASTGSYKVNAGDMLEISVWKEDDMLRETTVLPDGSITYPLVGQVSVVGMTPAEIQQLLSQRLARFYRDRESPYVTVVVKSTGGNRVYVIGEVRSPGVFVITQPVDVMQALSMAGGLNEFADKGAIRVLRRSADGRQQTINFDYSAVRKGRELSSNIILQGGDTVVVP